MFLSIIIFLPFINSAFAKYNFNDEIKKISSEKQKQEILYGKEIIENTPMYIGPRGSKFKVTKNFMTCKNCHLDSGMREYGLHFFDSHSLYPQYRSREGTILTLADRINSCIKMPMLGTSLPTDSREMQAMLLYIRFLGAGRLIKLQDDDQRLAKIVYPATSATISKGKELYKVHCIRCHKEDGSGTIENGTAVYPPLWGDQSYRSGSSMHRVTIFARFIKSNMPFDLAVNGKTILTDEEAINIAAFVNSEHINSRPAYPEHLFTQIEHKPFDYPIGPFADPYPPDQHRYGPFAPIVEFIVQKRKYKPPTDGDLNSP